MSFNPFAAVAMEILNRGIEMRTNNQSSTSSLLPDGTPNPEYEPGGRYYQPPISLADTLAGRSGSGGGGSNLDRVAGTQADILGTQEDVINQLLALAQGYEPKPIGRLNVPDNRFLDEDMLAGLEARPDLTLLAQILGFSGGTNAAGTQASLGQQQSLFNQRASQQRSQDQGKAISNLIGDWLSNRNNNNTAATDTFDNFTSSADAADQGYYGFG